MRKKLLVLLLLGLITSVSISAESRYAQINKGKWAVNVYGGYMGYADEEGCAAFGMALRGYGAHLDFLFMPNPHKDDTGVDTWTDRTCFAFHAGYQLPISKVFRITPIIGYAAVSDTYTDGSNYSITSEGVSNYSRSNNLVSGFDYGGILTFNIKGFDIQLACTRYCLFGGIGFEF